MFDKNCWEHAMTCTTSWCNHNEEILWKNHSTKELCSKQDSSDYAQTPCCTLIVYYTSSMQTATLLVLQFDFLLHEHVEEPRETGKRRCFLYKQIVKKSAQERLLWEVYRNGTTGSTPEVLKIPSWRRQYTNSHQQKNSHQSSQIGWRRFRVLGIVHHQDTSWSSSSDVGIESKHQHTDSTREIDSWGPEWWHGWSFIMMFL